MPERAVDKSPDNPFTPQTARIGDLFAPFFTVRFATTSPQQGVVIDDETGAEQTATIGEADSIILQSDKSEILFTVDERVSRYRSYATSLTITNQGGSANLVELRIEPPLEDALVLIETPLLQLNSIMIVEWGWSSNDSQESLISDKHYFVCMPPKMDVKGTDVSITLTGVDLFGYSAMKRETSKIYKRTEPDDKNIKYDTDFKILEALAKKNGNMRLNTTLAPPGPVLSVGPGFTTIPIHTLRPINSRDAKAVEQNEKDWVFFKRVCDMNRCDFFTIGDTIYLVDHNFARVQRFAYRLVFWNQLQRSDDIPIYSFSTSVIPGTWPPAEASEVVNHSSNEDDLLVDEIRIDPQTAPDFETMGERGAGGKASADSRSLRISDDVQVIPNRSYAEDETGRRMSSPGGSPNRDEHVKQVVRTANTLVNQNLEVSIPGVPGLVPQQVVRVDGVSKIFSGPYMVHKVVHKISTDGYDCDVTLIRDSSTGDQEAGVGQRPQTGGNNPDRAPDGQTVDPVDGETG